MSWLGIALSFDEGARVNWVTSLPLAPKVNDSNPRIDAIAIQVIEYRDDVDTLAATSAVATLLPRSIIVLAGTLLDGDGWGAVIQHVPGLDALGPVEGLAQKAIGRALELVGLSGRHRTFVLDQDGLIEAYDEQRGYLESWSLTELALGLVANLVTNDSLAEIVDDTNDEYLEYEAEFGDELNDDSAGKPRLKYLHQLLREWAETYEGPEH